jgi:hypothetical protein
LQDASPMSATPTRAAAVRGSASMRRMHVRYGLPAARAEGLSSQRALVDADARSRRDR